MTVCENRNQINLYKKREKTITAHIHAENYPKLNKYEEDAIKVIAKSLYKNIQIEGKKSLELYLDIQRKFVE
jgi:ribosomal protein S13